MPQRKEKKKSEMQVSLSETDSDPARADLLIHVLNKLTCPLDQKLRAFKMHTKVGARSSILRNAASYKTFLKICFFLFNSKSLPKISKSAVRVSIVPTLVSKLPIFVNVVPVDKSSCRFLMFVNVVTVDKKNIQ